MNSISVILITLNEEKHIGGCLESVKWADEIILVDSHSADRTVEIARQYTDKIISADFVGYSENKQMALDHVTSHWVLWIDADERAMPGMEAEIRRIINNENSLDGYEIARRAYFLGRWIKHCGWYPGYVLRLFRKDKAVFSETKVHEGLQLNGARGKLKTDLLHYTDDNLEHYLWKFNRYTSLAAEEMYHKRKSAGFASILFRPLHTCLKMYIFKLGFLDGIQGFMLCLLSAGYVAVKYAKLWELRVKK